MTPYFMLSPSGSNRPLGSTSSSRLFHALDPSPLGKFPTILDYNFDISSCKIQSMPLLKLWLCTNNLLLEINDTFEERLVVQTA
jgi:hypothetical protein